MEITILGSGGYIPNKNQVSTGYLIENNGKYILLDCGAGTLWRMIQLNFKWQKINEILISHTHSDHINDLFAIIFSQLNRKKTLRILGPKNIKEVEKFIYQQMTNQCKPPKFVFSNITDKRIKIGGLKIKNLAVKHSLQIPELAYKISTGKKTVVFSSDLGPLIDKKSLIRFIKGTDILIGDAKGEKEGHLSLKELSKIAAKAHVKKLILSHQDIRYKKEMLRDCKKYFFGKIIAAKDLMKVKI